MTEKNKKVFKVIAVIVAIILIVALGVIISKKVKTEKANTPYDNSSIAMGTVISESIYSNSEEASKNVAKDLTLLINSLDSKNLSWRIKGADVYKINELKNFKASAITADCIDTCLNVAKDSNGVFDITVGELSTLWGIGTENARVPSDKEIEKALASINYNKVSVKDRNVSIAENQKLDLGAVGKGLACDSARDYLDSYNKNDSNKDKVNGAVISVGGSILLYGTNPSSDNGKWKVGIRDPFGDENSYAAVLEVGECCISTSGDYEKVLEKDGKKYHHILDPRTGYPASGDITGVTLISSSGLLSDALSTACFILGDTRSSMELLEKYDAKAIFFHKDGTVHASTDFGDSLKLVEDIWKLK